MFRQVCIIEPSFFMMSSGMHCRPFEGRHLVYCTFIVLSLPLAQYQVSIADSSYFIVILKVKSVRNTWKFAWKLPVMLDQYSPCIKT